MARAMDPKFILVTRETRLDVLVARYNSIGQARFYVEHLGADFDDYVAEDRQYKAAVQHTLAAVGDTGRVQVLQRRYLPNFIFAPEDVVVVLGQDGLVANTLKYLDGQPVIGVNPDPARWDGVLLPFSVADAGGVAREVADGGRTTADIAMARAALDDGRELLAVNDLFIGMQSHVSARYEIIVGDMAETQSSSGIIVSTGLGSTGWMKSIFAGLTGMTRALGGQSPETKAFDGFAWNADHLVFAVREPFPSRTTGSDLVWGRVSADAPLRIRSAMADRGVIFSDGIESDFLEFTSGMTATIQPADRRGRLVV